MPEVEQELVSFKTFACEDEYYNWNLDYVPSLYIDAVQQGWVSFESQEEVNDKEILRFVEASGALNFLKGPEEDIYGLDDGEPL